MSATDGITYQDGQFCWTELATVDVEGAKAFYGGVLGWEFTDRPMPGDVGVYILISMDGQDVGGMYDITAVPDLPEGVPPHWMPYIHVDDVDAVLAAAQESGGGMTFPAMDVPAVGRMAGIRDPHGAAVALFRAAGSPGAQRCGMSAGAFTWWELATPDIEAAKAFYTGILPWTSQDMEMGSTKYSMMMLPGCPAGGMLEMTDDWKGIPPHWMSYIAVPDCDAACAKVVELGGKVCVQPFDIPNVGRNAVINDPQGAAVSLIKLVEQPAG
jgi:predicted enzyme related to lactoylglutathione lyase